MGGQCWTQGSDKVPLERLPVIQPAQGTKVPLLTLPQVDKVPLEHPRVRLVLQSVPCHLRSAKKVPLQRPHGQLHWYPTLRVL